LGEGNGFRHPSLALPWKSSLVSLHLGDRDHPPAIPLLQRLLERHASTLQELTVPHYYQNVPLARLALPRLHTLQLSVSRSSASLPLSFSDSPLRLLIVHMDGGGPGSDSLADKVQQLLLSHPQKTLREVSVVVDQKAQREEWEALDRLKRECWRAGVVYDQSTS
jgi:hypothetical protein